VKAIFEGTITKFCYQQPAAQNEKKTVFALIKLTWNSFRQVR